MAAHGFLMVTMEPPSSLEEEFNDWYDTEHLPERRAIDGFLSGTRYVCLSGWPRYMAFYELRDANVLMEPGYQAICGDRYSPWSKRILQRVRGLYRASGEEIGASPTLQGPATRMALIKLRCDEDFNGDIGIEVKAMLERNGLNAHYTRVFRCDSSPGGEYLALVRRVGAGTPPMLNLHSLETSPFEVGMVNDYARYWSRGALPGMAPLEAGAGHSMGALSYP